MSGQFTRTLNFKCNDLGKDANLILTIDSEENPGIYKDVFPGPTAYKVTPSFEATGGYSFQLRYKSQLGFTRAQISTESKVEPASTYIPMNVGEKTLLTKDGNTSQPPTDIKPSEQIVAQNDTTGEENIGIGLFVGSPEKPPIPPSTTILPFKDVGSTSSVQIQFTPVLRGYITTSYQETGILRGRIMSPVLFNEDLTQLEEKTTWKITYNALSGVFQIDKV